MARHRASGTMPVQARVGLGREMAKWTWDVAYQLTRGTSRTVSGSAVTSAGPVCG
ncbi:MAG: hypothetical protein ABI318_22495 [Chthoniobacteraceae bacterium]